MKTAASYQPLVSVITVARNAADVIEETIRSVAAQTYPHIEYIVIDGASIDGMAEIVRACGGAVDRFVSEPDAGIYDAMNKGLRMARGEWVNFMNAGDRFFNERAIEDVFSIDASECDVLYGHFEVRYEERYGGMTRIQKARDVRHLWKGMISSHQSFFVRRDAALRCSFECDTITADFTMMYRLYLEGARFIKRDTVVASIAAGGISDRDRMRSLRDAWRSAHRLRGGVMVDLYYALHTFFIFALTAAQNNAPDFIVTSLIRLFKR